MLLEKEWTVGPLYLNTIVLATWMWKTWQLKLLQTLNSKIVQNVQSETKFTVLQSAAPITQHEHKPSSCVSRAATRWLQLSPSCSAELSLVCSSTAFCWWAEASSCSWDSRAADEAKSSVRRTWWRRRRTGGRGERRGVYRWLSTVKWVPGYTDTV